MPVAKSKKIFTRAKFELIANKKALTVKEIIEMLHKGQIREDDYIFTLQGIKDVAYEAFRGGWSNRSQLGPANTDWNNRRGGKTDADEFIAKAFTG